MPNSLTMAFTHPDGAKPYMVGVELDQAPSDAQGLVHAVKKQHFIAREQAAKMHFEATSGRTAADWEAEEVAPAMKMAGMAFKGRPYPYKAEVLFGNPRGYGDFIKPAVYEVHAVDDIHAGFQGLWAAAKDDGFDPSDFDHFLAMMLDNDAMDVHRQPHTGPEWTAPVVDEAPAPGM